MPIAADQPEHRILQDIERILVVPDGEPCDTKRTPLDTGQEPLHRGPLLQKPLLSLRTGRRAWRGVGKRQTRAAHSIFPGVFSGFHRTAA